MDEIPPLTINNFSDLIRLYRSVVTDPPVRCDPTIPPVNPIHHGSWMLDNMPDQADAEKFNRCLGFLQCILWIGGIYTLEQLGDQTRPAAQAIVKPPHVRNASYIAGLKHAQMIACNWYENERSADIRQEIEAAIQRVGQPRIVKLRDLPEFREAQERKRQAKKAKGKKQ